MSDFTLNSSGTGPDGGHHPGRAERLGQLYGEVPGTAGRRGDQYGLPRRDAAGPQRAERDQPAAHQGQRRRGVRLRGHVADQARVGEHIEVTWKLV